MIKNRVIAGRLKGKPIHLPDTPGTRPTKQIVRESLFNTLQNQVAAYPFVEVFAGSGSVGIEALSRGAPEAFFSEKDPAAFKVLKENLRILELTGCSHTYQGDSFTTIDDIIRTLLGRKTRAVYYLDPPFAIRQDQENIYEKTLRLIATLPDNTIAAVVIEHMSGVAFPETIGRLTKERSRKFGKTTLTYYTT